MKEMVMLLNDQDDGLKLKVKYALKHLNSLEQQQTMELCGIKSKMKGIVFEEQDFFSGV